MANYPFLNQMNARANKSIAKSIGIFLSLLFNSQSHLQGVKSRQNQGEAALCKTAKESTQRLYMKPKTVRYTTPC